jgi:hypothetical protein
MSWMSYTLDAPTVTLNRAFPLLNNEPRGRAVGEVAAISEGGYSK